MQKPKPYNSNVTRRYLIPKNNRCNVFLQTYHGDDPHPYLHDNPWNFIAILLRGNLLESKLNKDGWTVCFYVSKFWPRFYRAKHKHQLETLSNKSKATELIITGKRYRGWGYYNDGKLIEIMEFNDSAYSAKESAHGKS